MVDGMSQRTTRSVALLALTVWPPAPPVPLANSSARPTTIPSPRFQERAVPSTLRSGPFSRKEDAKHISHVQQSRPPRSRHLSLLAAVNSRRPADSFRRLALLRPSGGQRGTLSISCGSARPRPCSPSHQNQSWQFRFRSKPAGISPSHCTSGTDTSGTKATLWPSAGPPPRTSGNRYRAPECLRSNWTRQSRSAGDIQDIPRASLGWIHFPRCGCLVESCGRLNSRSQPSVTLRSTPWRGVSGCCFLCERKTRKRWDVFALSAAVVATTSKLQSICRHVAVVAQTRFVG